MLRAMSKLDPVVAILGLVAGAAAMLLGAGFWAIAVALTVLAAGGIVGALAAVVADVEASRYVDPQELSLRRRARSAVRTARRLHRSAPGGPIAERFRAAQVQLEASASGIDKLTARATAVRRLRDGIDPGATARVDAVMVLLRTRAQTLVESLESVVARQIEVLTLADVDPSGHGLAALERLSVEVDALRAGLDDAQRLGSGLTLNEFVEETK